MSPFMRTSASSRSLARQRRNASRPVEESYLDMDSDFESDGYSFEAGIRTPSAGQRVRAFLSPIRDKLRFPSSPSSPPSPLTPISPTRPVRQVVRDSIRPVRDVTNKIVESYRRYEEKRIAEHNARIVKRALEEAELMKIREMINKPCPIQQAKQDRAHEKLGRERRKVVEGFKAKALKRELEAEKRAEKREERIRRDRAKCTWDKYMTTDDCEDPPLPLDCEKLGWAWDPDLGLKAFGLSEIS